MIPVHFHPNPSSMVHSFLFLEQTNRGMGTWAITKDRGDICHLGAKGSRISAFTDLFISVCDL